MGDPFHHVTDGPTWELPKFIVELFGRSEHFSLPFGLTRYMVLQLVAFLLVLFIFRGLASRIASGKPATGIWWNFWETLALFIRDEVVRPAIGIPHHHDDHHGHDEHHGGDSHALTAVPATDGRSGHAESHAHSSETTVTVGHPADRYLPFVWSVFFYVLICNLLGAFPLMGSPTANINVTGAVALVTFLYVVASGSQESGFGGFLKSLVPTMELPKPMMVILWPMIWVIEAFGLLIKHGVLAIRLFANIMAGHTVLSVFLLFIATTQGLLWGVVVPASIFAQVAIGMLELFVAFLQAYVFAMLTSLFISAAVNPH